MAPKNYLINAIATPLIITGVSTGALAGAYYFQYVIGLQPCMLCLYQRVPHAIIIVLGVGAFILGWAFRKPKQTAFMVLLCAIGYCIEAILAFYHAGVERHWWMSILEACSNPMISTGSKDLLSQIEKAESVRCDSIPWEMFGISMAGYNAILSLGMFIYSLIASILITRRANGL